MAPRESALQTMSMLAPLVLASLACGPLAVGPVSYAANGGAGSAGAAAAQEPAPQPQKDSPSRLEFALGDGVIAVVGRELIRRDDVFAALSSGVYEKRIPGLKAAAQSLDEAVRQRAAERVLIEFVFDHLKTAGGRNQGYAPEMVAAILKRQTASFQRNVGGVVAASQLLRDNGLDPEALRARNEALLLRRTWEDSVAGRAAGPTGRASIDRFVPPSVLYLEYQRRLGSHLAEDRASLGEHPQRYVLQQVILGIANYNGMERAREIAEELRGAVEAGELTMEDAARQFTLPRDRQNQWQIDPLSEVELAAYSNANYESEELATWALAAAPGDLSAPFIYYGAPEGGVRKPRALVVYRLAEVLAPTSAEPFTSPELQRRLLEALQDEWDRARIDRGLLELLDATYVWQPALKEELLRSARRGPREHTSVPGVR